MVDWVDYLVFSVVLAISVGIGIFYGCFGSRQKTAKEYLLANRQMHYIPVALSMICSAVSAITLLANPVEVYLYGLQYLMVILSFIPFNLALLYLYIPVYFRLKVNSAYEFIELRFNHGVRMFVSILAILHVIVSMAIAIYAPALAINEVTQNAVSVDVICLIIYFVCIFYSALGGLKAVLWTDAFQAGVMLLSLAVIAGKGVSEVGGFGVVWERAREGDRLDVLNFDPDPRTRHTIWTCLIAGYFFWLPSYAATQLQVQRFLSMPNMASVKKALIINFFGLIVIVGLCFFTGLVVYATYWKCDPIENGEIEKSDQLLPHFVTDTASDIPGFVGLFIAGLTCASMSSLSSGLTALASITTYDYVSKLFPHLSDTKLSVISKINCLVLGMVSFGFVFVIKNMGDILPVTSSFLGVMLGPTLGIFSLGMMFPWANAEGAVAGLVTTFIIMISFVVGTNLSSVKADLPKQGLPLLTTECDVDFNSTTTPGTSSALLMEANHWKDQEYSGFVQLMSMSYMWYSGLGCALVVFLGTIFSLLWNFFGNRGEKRKLVDGRCMSPPVLALYDKFFPNHLREWVDVDRAKEDDHQNVQSDEKTFTS